MGSAKSALPFGPQTMLERILEIVSATVSPVVVVAAANHEIDVESLREVDPELSSFRNLNTPADYQQALLDAGFTPPAPNDSLDS